MKRLRTSMLIVGVASVLMIAGPGAVAESGPDDEVRLLRETLKSLHGLLERYELLCRHYISEERPDDAKAVVEQIKDVREQMNSLEQRIREAEVKARKASPAEPEAGDEPLADPSDTPPLEVYPYNDTSVTGWMVMALSSAKHAGKLRVPEECFKGARLWLDKVTEPASGKVGYTAPGTGPARPTEHLDKFPPGKSEALTAVGIAMRIFMGEDPRTSQIIRNGTNLLLKRLPEWSEQAGTIDMDYWYYGSLAMFQVGGESWKTWNMALKPAVIDHQRKDGDQRGSWDPAGAWGGDGGRVYSTALMVMSLETYYRYGRIFGVRTWQK